MASSRFVQQLGQALPKGVKLSVRHVACPPTPCEPIFSPPPGEGPEPTKCENHFLAVSIRPEEAPTDTDSDVELLILSIEVLVYTTRRLATVFVSKADSTGYLYLLNQPRAKSLTRTVFTVFLSSLLREYQRPGIRLVLSLFARAQSQYLFPGSIENVRKHVLDDRGLIKWWCRVFDPILRDFEPEKHTTNKSALKGEGPDHAEAVNTTATAYLIVPGLDQHETRALFPSTARLDPKDKPRWLNSHPLYQVCANPGAPPRCLVPRFPDDPKARFLDDLDEEIFGHATTSTRNKTPKCVRDIIDVTEASSQDHAATGRWPSVKSLEEFWEMMTFRQECSAGRLVGFIWMVVNPPGVLKSDGLDKVASARTGDLIGGSVNPGLESVESEPQTTLPIRSSTDRNGGTVLGNDERDDKALSQTENTSAPKAKELITTETGHQISPFSQEKYTILLSPENYAALSALLLKLDFADKGLALTSTKSWLDKLSSLSGRSNHGEIVAGINEQPSASAEHPADPSNPLNSGLIFKKRKLHSDTDSASMPTQQESRTSVNVLSATLIRKKKKTG
ncbi:hypothetical protein DIZ76_013325 [Coccidioides immitis]|nr:hypothetical protein DIZ76_013325 [Coccidioides immitis]